MAIGLMSPNHSSLVGFSQLEEIVFGDQDINVFATVENFHPFNAKNAPLLAFVLLAKVGFLVLTLAS